MAGAWTGFRVVLALFLGVSPSYAQTPRTVEGMWSDPPSTPEDVLCGAMCSDAALDRLNALLDDPANDDRTFGQLRLQAEAHQRDQYIKPRLTSAAAAMFPVDPATDPSFLLCEPYGLARQVFARHQLAIKRVGSTLEMRYGEWAAKRTIEMDRTAKLPANRPPTRLGYSVGRFEGDTLVIESAGVLRHLALTGGLVEVSEQLHLVERYTPSADGKRLMLSATLTDPATFREPLVLKRVWRWAPEAEIVDDLHCERPTEVRRQAR